MSALQPALRGQSKGMDVPPLQPVVLGKHTRWCVGSLKAALSCFPQFLNI